MTLLDLPVPSLIGGVSQQDPKIRLSNQLEEQVNAHSSPTRGLVKRPPTQHIGTAFDVDPGNLFYHTINRDPQERYFVTLQDGALKVFSALTGQQYVITNDGIPNNPGSQFPNFDPDFSYLTLPNGTLPSEAFAALTVNDFTFIANRTIAPALTLGTNADADLTHAYLYVRQGAYSATYTVDIKLEDDPLNPTSDHHTVSVATWDGQAAVNEAHEVWKITFATPTGIHGDVWEVILSAPFSTSVSVTVTPANRPLGLWIKELADLLSAEAGVSCKALKKGGGSLQPYYGLRITADDPGVSFTPTVEKNTVLQGPPAVVATEEISATTPEIESIATDEIAAKLRSLLSDIPDLLVTQYGSVIRITSTLPLATLDVTDSIGDTALVRINRRVDNYTDLPQVCTNGYVVKVVGAPGEEDDFYVKFVADIPDVLSKGVWEETVDLRCQDGFDPDTMPWKLVRRQAVGNSIPGVADGEIFFSWEAVTWDTRDVGDRTSNPAPSFIAPDDPSAFAAPPARYIDKLFFWQNRLGFVSGQQVILSETGRYYNFWRTTTTALLDSDPVDIAASHDIPVYIQHLTPLNGRLILWAARAQLELTGEPILTPQTAAIQPLTTFEFAMESEPAALGSSVIFGRSRGAYAAFGEVYQQGDNNNLEDTDISGQIPRYVPAGVRYLAGSTTEDVVVAVTSGSAANLFIYKFYWGGAEKLQSAWYRWDLGCERVAYADFLDSDLYLFVAREGALHLEKITLEDTGVEGDLDRIIHLDRRLLSVPSSFSVSSGPVGSPSPVLYSPTYSQAVGDANLQASFDPSTNLTTYTLPYTLADDEVPMVVSAEDGQDLHCEQISATEVAVEGDTVFTSVYIGTLYEMRVRLTEPHMQEQTGRGRGFIGTGVLQVKRLNVNFTNTGYLRVEVSLPGRTEVYSSEVVDIIPDVLGELDAVRLRSGSQKLPVLARNEGLVVELVNDTHLPSNIVSVEWLAEFTSQSTRYSA